jgi:hypothetical protein
VPGGVARIAVSERVHALESSAAQDVRLNHDENEKRTAWMRNLDMTFSSICSYSFTSTLSCLLSFDSD